MKKDKKGLKKSHTSNSKQGRGDFYGSAISNKVGKVRKALGLREIGPGKIKTPPKSMA